MIKNSASVRAVCLGFALLGLSIGAALAAGGPPRFTNGPPPPAAVGALYSFTYTASGATPITFSVTAGALPPGLSLTAAGQIIGVPTTTSTAFTGTVTASNGTGNATQDFDIAVTVGPVVTEFSADITAGAGLSGITAGPDGNLWFAEASADQIGRITPLGVVTGEFSTNISAGATPAGITALDGNLWFAESLVDRIGQITPLGVVTEFSINITAGAELQGITAGPDGNVWFTEHSGNRIGRIIAIEQNGNVGDITEFSAGISAGALPTGITAGPDGNLWFTEQGGSRIGRITPLGVVTEFSAGISAGAGSTDITAGPDGNLWFVEFNGSRIGRITPDGAFVTEFSAGITANAGPNRITVGPDGNLWFTESLGNRIGRITTGLATAPAFTNGPPPASAMVGTPYAFSYTASGAAPISFSVSVGALPPGLSLSSAGDISGVPSAPGTFTGTVTASNGTAPDATQDFSIAVADASVAPIITSANAATFIIGTAGSFIVTATGSPTPTLSESGALPSGVTFNASTGVLSGTPVAGTAGTYNLVFTAANGVAPNATQNFTLTVNQAPAITTQPVNQTVCAGQSVSFTAAASGTPAPTVQWQVSISGGPFTDMSGATSTTLTFTTFGSQNGYQYHAVFTNVAGSATSSPATLTVNTAPAVTTQPANQTVNAGQTATFTAAANGSPSPTVQWQVSTDGGSTFNNVSGATSTTLTFTAASSQNGNLYRAVFTNTCGTVMTTFATLTVNTAPAITTQPVSQTICAGSSVSFTAAASGPPAPTVQWQVSTDGGVTFTNVSGATSTTLTFTASASQNGNQYRAVFTNVAGTATSNAATLTVNTAPAITTQPSNQTVNAGQTATFTAAASGTPTPTVQWQVSTNGGTTFTDISGATSTTLTFTAAGSQNGNQYRAVFTNSCGTATSNAATLTVNQAPAITSSNATTFTVGTAGSFTVTATGSPAPTLSESGALPSGVTFNASTGVLSGTPAAGTAGTYNLIFTAANGVAPNATQNFTLTVNQAQTATHFSVAAPVSVTAGNAFNLTVRALDASNNTVSGYTGTVHFTSSDAQAVLPSNYTFLAGDAGVKSFSVTLKTAGSRTVTVTDTSTSITGTATVGVNAGPPASIIATAGTPQSAAINTAFATNLSATVKDSSNNPVGGVVVMFTAPSSGASGTFAGGLTMTNATTNANGLATASIFTANGTTGSYAVTAAFSAATSPASFSLTNTPVVQCSEIVVKPGALPVGILGKKYSRVLTAVGGFGAVTFAVSDGALPPGLHLSAGTPGEAEPGEKAASHATLSGVPIQAGSFAFTITATDSKGCTGSRSYTLVIKSPKGNGKIAFSKSPEPGIFAINPNGHGEGQGETRITKDGIDPAWAPNGKALAYVRSIDSNNAVWISNVEENEARQLTSGPADFDPAWSPDGKKIAFVRDTSGYYGAFDIFVINADGTGLTRLTSGPESYTYNFHPSWSPDGSQIAFWSDRTHEGTAIFVMNADGSHPTRLTFGKEADSDPDWSPDGTQIVFTSNRNDAKRGQIYVMNVDGSGQTRLTSNRAFDGEAKWAPDGTQIVFTSNREGKLRLYVMNSDGTGQTAISISDGANRMRPAWQPLQSAKE